ncbi:hypothetical protein [uncultured Phenylobacterium sp.]|uniref:hypothetical protein n=1 Tax=uncultured Phenylobacterium sp. TaxID=349273 RepID=UPI0025DA4BAE|nr:hypothetical protein [uncultured Phenylobacterium sp.]
MRQVTAARSLLKTPVRRDPLWPALVAATALALTSVMFAAVAVLAPPATTEHMARSAPG